MPWPKSNEPTFEPYWPEYRKRDWLLIHQDLVSREGAAAEAALIIQMGLQRTKNHDDDDYLEFPMTGPQCDAVRQSAAHLGIAE